MMKMMFGVKEDYFDGLENFQFQRKVVSQKKCAPKSAKVVAQKVQQ